jgi:hypothetical protein
MTFETLSQITTIPDFINKTAVNNGVMENKEVHDLKRKRGKRLSRTSSTKDSTLIRNKGYLGP